MICAAQKVTDTGHQSFVIGVLTSYQDNGKGCTVIADKVSKPCVSMHEVLRYAREENTHFGMCG